MQEPSAAIQRQTPTDHIDRRQLSFCVTRRNVDDKPGDFAAHHPIERALDNLMMRSNNHLAAHALLEEVPGKVQAISLAHLSPNSVVSSHPYSSPA